jgi:taurine--2-oxoglutarate transaminase
MRCIPSGGALDWTSSLRRGIWLDAAAGRPPKDPMDQPPPAFSHDFWTWTAQALADPLCLDHAQGVYLWDSAGRRYLDFSSTVMCVNLGHGDPRVIAAIQAQAERLAYAGPSMATQVRSDLAQALIEIVPQGLNRFLFTLGGADAIENAVKLARASTGRPTILARHRSYHGATHGALALTGDRRRDSWEPFLMPGVLHFHGPDRGRAPFALDHPDMPDAELSTAALQHLEAVLEDVGPESVAAIVVETVPGANGVFVPPTGYLEGVRELCRQHGALLILDEVLTGFGRTGRWFACQHWEVAPDLMVLAKGLTSGYAPLGAVAISEPVAAAFDQRPFVSGLTYSGHPLSLSAALANIRALQADHLVTRADSLGPEFRAGAERLKSRHACVDAVRTIGLLGAVEIGSARAGHNPAWRGLARRLRSQGLWVHQHDEMLLLAPPLIITSDQLAEGFDILDRVLGTLDAGGGPAG